MKRKKDNILELYTPDLTTELKVPLSGSAVQAGFPSPAEDYTEKRIDLNKELIRNPSSTFFARVSGDSMIDFSIDDGDLLIVDKSLELFDNCIAVCMIDGEFTLKRVELHKEYALLIPANKKYKPIKVDKENPLVVWGILTHWIKSVYPNRRNGVL